MTMNLNPYLNFVDTAREAMEFYRDILGGELTISTFDQFGGGEGSTGVMHAQLVTPSGFVLMASDTPPGMESGPVGGFHVSLSGDDAEALRGYWAGLSEGATVVLPMEKQMWGDEFGMLVDRFGTPWMVDILPS